MSLGFAAVKPSLKWGAKSVCCSQTMTVSENNIAVMKRFMGLLSEAKEVEVLRNEPAYRIDVSPQFENNNRIRCFALKQYGSCKIAQ